MGASRRAGRRLSGPRATSVAQAAPSLPAYGSLLSAALTAVGGDWWDFLPAHCTITSNAVVSVTSRIGSVALTDGGTSTRRPAHDGVATATFDGASDYLTALLPGFDGATKVTIIALRSVASDDAIHVEISDNVNHIVDLGTTGGYSLWIRHFKDSFGDAQAAPSSGAMVDFQKEMTWQSGVIDWAANPVVRALAHQGRSELIARGIGVRSGTQTATGGLGTAQIAFGGRISGASLQSCALMGVIVAPIAATATQIATWIDYFNGYLTQNGVPTPMIVRSTNVWGDVSTPRSAAEKFVIDGDAVCARAKFVYRTNLQPGDVWTVLGKCNLQAAISVSLGVDDGYGIQSLGNDDNAPIDGDWIEREHDVTNTKPNPTITLITQAAQAYAPAPPHDGVFFSGVVLPVGRVFVPVAQPTTRRMVIVGDRYTMGDDADSPQADDDYMTEGLSWYFDRTYPGIVTTWCSDVASYFKSCTTDYGSNAAFGAAIAAQAPNASDEIFLALGYEDAYLDDAEYANLAAFRSRIAAVLTAIRAGTSAKIYFQTLLDGLGGADPTPTLGTVAQVRAAMAGAVTDSGAANVTTISGAGLWTTRDAYGPAVRAAMGSW